MNYNNFNFLIKFIDNLISLHHDTMWYIIIILTLVYWSLYKILKEYSWNTCLLNINSVIPISFKLNALLFRKCVRIS